MLYIDSDECTGCGTCVDVCLQRAISIQNDIAVINHRLCSQCGNCGAVCPAGAIYEVAPVYAASVKGGDEMRGRGWFGWGPGFGRGGGWGRGNPYPFCRRFPWMPRWWWAHGMSHYTPYYGQTPATHYTPYTPYPQFPVY